MSQNTVSVVDLFSVGIGPSSSHTVGPMRAAMAFVDELGYLPARVAVELRGSLAATGVGHGTDRAVLLGLVGYTPTTTTPDISPVPGEKVPERGTITGPAGSVDYEVTFNPKPVAHHPNCLIFDAWDAAGNRVTSRKEYYSVGGGFILDRAGMEAQRDQASVSTEQPDNTIPYEFHSGAELMAICRETGLSIADVMRANEDALAGWEAVSAHLDNVWDVMQECVAHGLKAEGILPGGLGVTRRAPRLYRLLTAEYEASTARGLDAMEWVNLYALAVNEENAAHGQIVTAPTNGAAGIIPAVMHYCRDFTDDFTAEKAREFLLTAGAIGAIIKTNASISGAEVGCQGEVGSASSMAAAGMCAILGGTPEQVENAAEIALEHNLGLTCDPVGGLVQVPCIERNAIGGVKAINAARLAKLGNGTNIVTLDDVVETMAATGRDMKSTYKETSMGGLAVQLGLPVNITEC
ncbi:L-serine ammonia-lyase [Corynebacterium liangguodongii]|uniref:L-serine dehydratase n=1 Tax=Corynebacterium liangguodongii TaxID=2079535 RepID=A0A2S0WEM6_9CORY|nr:L-serine ammonia-lyase [Corynebacterium liangguodongii]AWB84112.1 L-serine ammonia-lyase [Corynebacterium liangguodongii]PWC00123.1 L-serine ammonia-lyase [Corynebacterium liangguodongii]